MSHFCKILNLVKKTDFGAFGFVQQNVLQFEISVANLMLKSQKTNILLKLFKDKTIISR